MSVDTLHHTVSPAGHTGSRSYGKQSADCVPQDRLIAFYRQFGGLMQFIFSDGSGIYPINLDRDHPHECITNIVFSVLPLVRDRMALTTKIYSKPSCLFDYAMCDVSGFDAEYKHADYSTRFALILYWLVDSQFEVLSTLKELSGTHFFVDVDDFGELFDGFYDPLKEVVETEAIYKTPAGMRTLVKHLTLFNKEPLAHYAHYVQSGFREHQFLELTNG